MNTPKLLAAVLAALVAAPALAGVFSVSPVRIYMTPRDRAVAVTLTNEGDTPVALQADINSWAQKPDGTDELVLTDDLILSPPIIKLAPNARQVVRLALLKPADASRQLTYRLIIREVPEATAGKGNAIDVPIALALSMPVFITPPVAKRNVSCTLQRKDAQTAEAVCANSGTAYAQVRGASLKRGDQLLGNFEGGVYVLPGASKTLAIKGQAALPAGIVELSVTFDDGQTTSSSVTLP
ncbi:molecular chaperone [Polaromonas sp. SM01]|uniref:fimbrial biogenesis chaperone n=1 Tax=Polaromonas sp. SM01 TaxID=3085630 RepID=UPI002980D7D1|nr:fimbria/pilus periplasmic chaperone [Polaromonas sp. SM01]MDW5442463.1 fimbria/pilus periplasmic chaperone [Polaromonas sp. SM01]